MAHVWVFNGKNIQEFAEQSWSKRCMRLAQTEVSPRFLLQMPQFSIHEHSTHNFTFATVLEGSLM